jgi:predicted porin
MNRNFYKKGMAAGLLLGAASAANAITLAEADGTTVSLGGYIKAEAVFNRPDTNAAEGAENSFIAGMRQSRFNLNVARDVEGHRVSGFIEGDFYGNSKADEGTAVQWRMRHAVIQVDDLTIGQFWSGQMLATAPLDVEMLNFWGAGSGSIAGNGATVRPQLLVHYQRDGLRISVQDPVNLDATYPDLVASYRLKSESGAQLSVALTGRDVDLTPADDDDGKSRLGLGASLAAKLPLGRTSLHLSGYTGKGMGAYSGVGVGGAYRGADRIDAEGEKLVRQDGFMVGVRHEFNDALRANVRFSKVMVNDKASTGMVSNNINLMYRYLPGLEFGMEWQRQTLGTVSPANSDWQRTRPKGQQLEVMTMFKF